MLLMNEFLSPLSLYLCLVCTWEEDFTSPSFFVSFFWLFAFCKFLHHVLFFPYRLLPSSSSATTRRAATVSWGKDSLEFHVHLLPPQGIRSDSSLFLHLVLVNLLTWSWTGSFLSTFISIVFPSWLPRGNRKIHSLRRRSIQNFFPSSLLLFYSHHHHLLWRSGGHYHFGSKRLGAKREAHVPEMDVVFIWSKHYFSFQDTK